MLYKKAIILGAGGFIGINLSHLLSKTDIDLICFDRQVSPYWPQSAKAIVGDFYEAPENLLTELNNTIIFHLVSSCKPSSYTQNAADEITKDLASTIRYLEATKKNNVRWVFLSSGGTVYGEHQEEFIDELAYTNPICSYGAMKLATERYLDLYHILHDIDFVTMRLANPYGPWQLPFKGQGVIAALLYKAIKKDTIEIWGDGNNIRDYIFINDASEGLMLAAQKGLSAQIYNIGAGNGLTINQLITIINEKLNLDLRATYTERRSIDVRRNVLDSNKLMKDTGWHPTTIIEDGLRMTLQWLQNNISIMK